MKNVIVKCIESTERGYVRIGMDYLERYEGKYGKGIKVHYNNPNSTRYNMVRYYIVSNMTNDFYYRFAEQYHMGLHEKYYGKSGKRASEICDYNAYAYALYRERLLDIMGVQK